MRLVRYLIDEVIGADGPIGLNGLIRVLTDGTGSMSLSNTTFPSLLPFAIPTLSLIVGNLSLANLTLSINAIDLKSLDNVSTLQLTPIYDSPHAKTLPCYGPRMVDASVRSDTPVSWRSRCLAASSPARAPSTRSSKSI